MPNHYEHTRRIAQELKQHDGDSVAVALDSGHTLTGTLDVKPEGHFTITEHGGRVWSLHLDVVTAIGA